MVATIIAGLVVAVIVLLAIVVGQRFALQHAYGSIRVLLRERAEIAAQMDAVTEQGGWPT